MLGSDPRDASLALPIKPLDEVYAIPARTFIEKHGGDVGSIRRHEFWSADPQGPSRRRR
jgi:hypothetical protein